MTTLRHLDLFSGIGGFAYAADQVFGDVEHVFCDNDKFCRAVLKKHWPESEIYDDIRQITSNPNSAGLQGKNTQRSPRFAWVGEPVDLVTGGFPCQPFSQAGLRRGTADDRHLWPEMLRVIRLTEPEWVIAENVRGIVTWNDGLVFEQVCADLEANGYDVQPLIVPAVAVNAPHRRDRVWFLAHRNGLGPLERRKKFDTTERQQTLPGFTERPEVVTNTSSIRWQARRIEDRSQDQKIGGQGQHKDKRSGVPDWGRDWPEVATELCSMDDGIPARMGGLELTKSQHRKEQLKAFGNAIVPQVAMQIMEAIKIA